MLHLCHDDNEDKRYQLELSWITEDTKYIHKKVSAEVIKAVEVQALEMIEKDAMGDDD